jgi:hypothetical protein
MGRSSIVWSPGGGDSARGSIFISTKGAPNMLVKGSLVTQMSGSLGGITASRNRGGQYFRARALPVNPNSNRQQVMRMYMDTAVTYWTESLTDIERLSWQTYADNVAMVNRVGDSVFLSGQQQWIRSAVPWLLGGQDLDDIRSAPTIFDTGDPGTLSLTSIATDGTIVIGIAGAPGWAGVDEGRILCFVSQPQNQSKVFFKGPFRFCGFVAGDVATPITSASFDADNADPPVAIVQNAKTFVRVRCQYPDGRLTQAFIFEEIAV